MSSLARMVGKGARPPSARLINPQPRGHGDGIPTSSAAVKDGAQRFSIRRTPHTVTPEKASPSSSTRNDVSVRRLGLDGQSTTASLLTSPAWSHAPIVRSSSSRQRPAETLLQDATEAMNKPHTPLLQTATTTIIPSGSTFEGMAGQPEATPTKSKRSKHDLRLEDLVRQSKAMTTKHKQQWPDLGYDDTVGKFEAGAITWQAQKSAELGFDDMVTMSEAATRELARKTSSLGFEEMVEDFEARPPVQQPRTSRLGSEDWFSKRNVLDMRFHKEKTRPKVPIPRTQKQSPVFGFLREENEESNKLGHALAKLKPRARHEFSKYIRSKVEKRQIAKMYQYLMADISPGVEFLRRRIGRFRQWIYNGRDYNAEGRKVRDTHFLDKTIAQITSMIEELQVCEVVILEVMAYEAARKAVQSVQDAITAGKPMDAETLQLVWAPCPHSEKKASIWFPARLRSWWDKNYLMTAVNGGRTKGAAGTPPPPPTLRRLAALSQDDPRMKPYQYAISLAVRAECAAVEAGLAKFEKNKIVLDIMWDRWSSRYMGYKRHMDRAQESRKREELGLPKPRIEKKAEAAFATVAEQPAWKTVTAPQRAIDNRFQVVAKRHKTKVWNK